MAHKGFYAATTTVQFNPITKVLGRKLITGERRRKRIDT
jgi:hypothetical protein